MASTQSASDGASTPLAYSNGQGSSEYYAQSQSLSQPNPAVAAVPTMRYSTLTGVSGALQTKNMSSGFMKEAKNVYWNRRKNDTRQYIREQKAAKRRRFVDGTGGGEAADEDGQEDDRATSAAPARSNNGKGNDENGDESSGGEDRTSVGAGSARGRASQTPDVKGKGREYTNVRLHRTRLMCLQCMLRELNSSICPIRRTGCWTIARPVKSAHHPSRLAHAALRAGNRRDTFRSTACHRPEASQYCLSATRTVS